MAQFKGSIQGSRGQASRLGSKVSGLVARVNGWDLGVEVRAIHLKEGGDAFIIVRTGGSNCRGRIEVIGDLSAKGWVAYDLRQGGR